MTSFKKGDKVCALLVANRWGIDFTCFCGRLVRIEQTATIRKAVIKVTVYIDLQTRQKHPPSEYTLDVRLFKLLHWNEETKAKIKELRAASRKMHKLTRSVRAL